MTNEEIIQGNKLIAEFMGLSYDAKKSDSLKFYKEVNNDGWLSKSYCDPKYEKNWNALMLVVEKIEQGNYGFKMCRKVVEIYYDDTKEVILKVKERGRLQSLYKAVIDFINWYNKTKS